MLFGAAAVAAQDPDADATARRLSLSAGFSPDPMSVPLPAGGPLPAPAVAAGCAGRIGAAPQVVLDYAAGGFPLYLTVDSASDTSLVVQDPDGGWHCSDDALGRLPLVEFADPAAGRYAVFVGVSGADAATAEAPLAILRITELRP